MRRKRLKRTARVMVGCIRDAAYGYRNTYDMCDGSGEAMTLDIAKILGVMPERLAGQTIRITVEVE